MLFLRLTILAVAVHATLLEITLRAAQSAQWHVSPAGMANGDGSIERPWDLQTALHGAPNNNGQPRVSPGDTIWLHQGTYQGGYLSTLEGTAEQPIVLRQAPGERAIIDCRVRDDHDDGLFAMRGAHTIYWGFEITCTNKRRETEIPGSWPEDMQRGAVNLYGSHLKLINLIIHDTGGIGAWSEGEGGEIYGCLIYNNGWKGPERGHGHAIYAQNRHGVKRLVDNVIFNQFSYGIHCYGSAKAYLEGFHIEGNTSFNNGSLASPANQTPAIFVGGEAPVKRIQIVDNYVYNGGLQCGYPWGVVNDDAAITGNYLVGGLRIRDFRQLTVSHNTVVATDTVVSLEDSQGDLVSFDGWDHNEYFRTGKEYADVQLLTGDKLQGLEYEKWRATTGNDRNSKYLESSPTGIQVFVRPNLYEAGRAHVIVYNWDEAKSIDVDLANVLREGQPFRITSAQNYHGAPVVEGRYQGGKVSIPMRPTAAEQPIGMPDYALPITEPQFGVFVVQAE